jgi:hypothetical protein
MKDEKATASDLAAVLSFDENVRQFVVVEIGWQRYLNQRFSLCSQLCHPMRGKSLTCRQSPHYSKVFDLIRSET